MSYRLAALGVIRLADNLHITRDMGEWEDYRAWLKAGVPAPMPAIVVQPPSLAELKQLRANVITAEALARIQSALPEVGNMATAMLVRELWLSIAPAARAPTAKMATVVAIYLAWGSALAAIKICTTPVCVAAVVPTWPA